MNTIASPPTTESDDDWVVILAGGEGRRLHALSRTASGEIVPKQFCSLCGGPSLLQETVRRARALSSDERICVVLTEQHRRWWQAEISAGSILHRNLIVEPCSRGTAIGLLTALLNISARAPNARIIVLPCDHHVQDEATLTDALRQARRYVGSRADKVLLLGMEPDEPDTELGYIVPGQRNGFGTYAVEHIAEKPALPRARELLEEGALWNSFVLAASAQALVQLYRERFPELVCRLDDALRSPASATELQRVYEWLPTLDFCADVLEQTSSSALRVLAVPHCGWSDIGTVKHLSDALERTELSRRATEPNRYTLHVDLASERRRMQARSPGADNR